MTPLDKEFFTAAAFLFERERGVLLEPSDHVSIRAVGLDSATAEEVAARIWTALENDLSEECRGTAYWALGKSYRKVEKERLVSALKAEVAKSLVVAYQIMVALDNLDEPVFSPERNGASVREEAQNLADAQRYLAYNR